MQKTKDMKKVYLLLGAVLVTAVLFSCSFSIKNGSRKGQRVKVLNKDVKVQSFEKVEIAGAFDPTKGSAFCTPASFRAFMLVGDAQYVITSYSLILASLSSSASISTQS